MARTAEQKLTAKIKSQTTAQLLSHHGYLRNLPEDNKGPEHRLLAAMIADEIEDRLDLGDAVHQVFDADDDLDCYHEAILRAIVLKGVRV